MGRNRPRRQGHHHRHRKPLLELEWRLLGRLYTIPIIEKQKLPFKATQAPKTWVWNTFIYLFTASQPYFTINIYIYIYYDAIVAKTLGLA
jgi:hypothetical protein